MTVFIFHRFHDVCGLVVYPCTAAFRIHIGMQVTRSTLGVWTQSTTVVRVGRVSVMSVRHMRCLHVPWRGWNTPPRVCDTCYQKYSKHTPKKVAFASADSTSEKDVASSSHSQKVTACYVTEMIQTAAQYVGGAVS